MTRFTDPEAPWAIEIQIGASSQEQPSVSVYPFLEERRVLVSAQGFTQDMQGVASLGELLAYASDAIKEATGEKDGPGRFKEEQPTKMSDIEPGLIKDPWEGDPPMPHNANPLLPDRPKPRGFNPKPVIKEDKS